jgi:hypothetical protein
VGVGPEAEDVYQFLLGEPGATIADIQRGAGLSRDRTRTALHELEQRAIVSQRSGSPARFQPAPPDIVVEALISAQEEALHQTRLDGQQLQSLQRVSPEQTKVTELVEVLTSRQSHAERWIQLQTTTKESLEVFVRPPFAHPHVEESERMQGALLGRGVASRGVYDQAAFQHPGVLDHARRMAALGERARVVTKLPMKLSVADRTTALVPFTQPGPAATVDAALVVHKSPLLDALIDLFDLYWERGADLDLGVARDNSHFDPADEGTVLTLMAAGWKDDAIAGRLGVSTQTIRRRISAVQQRLGVDTRFQVGLALGRQSWQNGPARSASDGDGRPEGHRTPRA